MTGRLDRRLVTGNLRLSNPAGHTLGLVFGGCRFSIESNRGEIIEALGAYFSPFPGDKGTATVTVTVIEAPPPDFAEPFVLKEPEPGKSRIKEEYLDLENGRIVRKRLTGMVFVFGEGDNLAVGPCRENLNQVVNFINNRYIEWKLCRGALLGHAAGVGLNGNGLALAGFSGAGKSTLALHIMSRGATFVSNDRLMVEKTDTGLVMHGVAKLPRINPGTIVHNPDLQAILDADDHRKFKELPPDELRQLELKYDASIDECFGPGRFHLHADMAGLVVLNWKQQGGPLSIRRVDPLVRTDLLPAFMKPTGLFFYPGSECRMTDPTPEAYARLLNHGCLWEVSGGVDFHKAADACARFLRYGIMPEI
ncbi:MAG: HprK-related kinase B [Thermodesulfobacteriota bacterium]